MRVVGLLAEGVAVGTSIVVTPAGAHVGGSVAHLWNHLKPLADARYVNVGGKASDAELLDGKESSEFAPAGVEPWQEVTSFAFSRWANLGGSLDTVGYYRDPYGVVHEERRLRRRDEVVTVDSANQVAVCGGFAVDETSRRRESPSEPVRLRLRREGGRRGLPRFACHEPRPIHSSPPS